MLKINTLTKHYICCSRSTFNNTQGNYDLEGVLSQQYSDTISYSYSKEIAKDQLDTIDRNDYDVFEYEIAELDWNDYRWKDIFHDSVLQTDVYSYPLFLSTCNLYLKKHGYPEILLIYHTKNPITSLFSFSREWNKKKKFITYVIVKDSVKYIPTTEHPECALKSDYKLKMFNQMYAPSIETGLKSLGLIKYDYGDLAELREGGDIIRLSLRVQQAFRDEMFATLMALKNEILTRMFNGKLKFILESNKMNVDSVFKCLLERLDQSYGQLNLNIPTKDIL